MAVRAFTDSPSQLLEALKGLLENGDVDGWGLDGDGDLYRSGPDVIAWMRPKILEDRVAFYILGSKRYNISTETYAVYHGELIALLLRHFDSKFKTVSATAMPAPGDRVKTATPSG